jgi:hypothetical protein
VLFCGEEFHDGYRLTAAALAGDPRFAVACCPRELVPQRIVDADMAVRDAAAAAAAARECRAQARV